MGATSGLALGLVFLPWNHACHSERSEESRFSKHFGNPRYL
jgi:hypothetical protein